MTETTGRPSRRDQEPERRTHSRTALVGNCMLWTGRAGPLRFLIENLSVGGALLTGGPLLAKGEAIRVILQLQGQTVGPLSAEVVRQAGVEPGLGIAFRGIGPADEDAIQQAVLEALEADDRGDGCRCRTLVVDSCATARQMLQRDLSSLGHGSVTASTPLEAMMRLEDPVAHFDVVLVDLRSGSLDGLAFLRYLAENHPETRRVLMSGEVRLDQLKLARVSGQADDILPKPWDRSILASIMRS